MSLGVLMVLDLPARDHSRLAEVVDRVVTFRHPLDVLSVGPAREHPQTAEAP